MKKKQESVPRFLTRSQFIVNTIKYRFFRALIFPPVFLISVLMHNDRKAEEALLELIKEQSERGGQPPVHAYVDYLREQGDSLGKYKGTEDDHRYGLRLRSRIANDAQYMTIDRIAKSLERRGIVYSRMFEIESYPMQSVVDRQGNYVKTLPSMGKYVFLVKK